MKLKYFFLFILITITLIICGCNKPEEEIPILHRVGDVNIGRFNHAATLLKDGRVLIVGGQTSLTTDATKAEIYDPATKSFKIIGNTNLRYLTPPNLISLPNGKVLIIDQKITEEFDPTNNVFNLINYNCEIAPSEAILLKNNKLLFTDCNGNAVLLDPETLESSTTGKMKVPRCYYKKALLEDGNVLIVGGKYTNKEKSELVPTLEIYDYKKGQFIEAGNLLIPREHPNTVVLKDGKVLITRGWFTEDRDITNKAELYDPVIQKSVRVGDIHSPHGDHNAILLKNGKVLFFGGNSQNFRYGDSDPEEELEKAFTVIELFDPKDQKFCVIGKLYGEEGEYVLTGLKNDDVLIVGGEWKRDPLDSERKYLKKARIYVPD